MTQDKQSYRGHWRVQIVPAPPGSPLPPADPNGVHYGVQFTGGFAYVLWSVLGEAATEVALQKLGHDGRFQVTEIAERTYRNESEAKKTYPL